MTRILVVEDDPTTSRSIELMLTRANFNVYCTDLGEEAIDLAKLYDYDLITLDLNLPDISGHEVLRRLRSSRIETPILILSGSDDIENKIKAFGFGADDYMTKPFHREELVSRIHAIIRRSKGRAPAVAAQVAVTANRKGFPILGQRGAYVDWQLVADHGGQANTNHGQTVARLAERGGLSWCELFAVLHNQRFQRMDANDAMIACRALEARYLAALIGGAALPHL